VEMEHLIGKDLIIKRAFQAIDQASWSEEQLRTYDKITKTELDNLAVEQQKLEDAEARGTAIGEARGKAEIAKKMLDKNRSLEEIIELTGLTKEEIVALKL